MIMNMLPQSALIGACAAIILRLIFLLLKKQTSSTWLKPLLKAGISGALLGMAGGWIGYQTVNWVSGYSQSWLVLLFSACLSAFIMGLFLQMLLERLIWRKLGWG